MDIAYCITAYNNFSHLTKLVDRLLSNNIDDAYVYIHIDKKSLIPTGFLNEFIKNNRVFIFQTHKVWWGGWSHQQAILDLLNSANNFKKFDSFVILSGQDYQVCNNHTLHEYLSKNKEFINILDGFDKTKPEWRLQKIHFEGFDRRNNKSIKTLIFKTIEKVLFLFYKKKNYPFKKVYHGPTWCALSGECVRYIIDFIIKNPDYVNFYKMSWCAEESFIPTIIGNSRFIDNIEPGFIYTDWNGPNPPIALKERHLESFISKKVFYNKTYNCSYEAVFARKFNDSSEALINKLDAIYDV